VEGGEESGRRFPSVKMYEITLNNAFKSYLMDIFHKIMYFKKEFYIHSK
jgi:hypothetical protein